LVKVQQFAPIYINISLQSKLFFEIHWTKNVSAVSVKAGGKMQTADLTCGPAKG